MCVCVRVCVCVCVCVCVHVSVHFFIIIYTLFTLHAPLLCSNTTCMVITFLSSSVLSYYLVTYYPILFIFCNLLPYSLFNTILFVNRLKLS